MALKDQSISKHITWRRRDGHGRHAQLPSRPVTMPVTALPIAPPQISRDGGAPDFGRRRNPDASAPRGRTHIGPRGGHTRIWSPTGLPHPPSSPRSRAPTNGPAEAMPRLVGPRPRDRTRATRPSPPARQIWPRPLPEGYSGQRVSDCERTCPSPGRRSRGTVGLRISAVDEIRMRPPPEGGRIRVRGAATPGFGAGRDCRTPLRLRARALRRTARPRQCLGSSGRGLASQAARCDLKWTRSRRPPLHPSRHCRVV